MIRSGSYFVRKQIVIVFKFPIVSPNTYNLYKLSLAPNKFHQVLIPPYPFIATNRNEFVYIEAECPKYENQFLCDENSHKNLKNRRDCIHEVIVRQNIGPNCSLSTEAMEQLDDRSYVISFPRPEKVHLNCGTQTYSTLNGSFLLTLPNHCSLHTPELTLTNENDVIQGKPLKIMKITYPEEMRTIASPHLNISSISLKSLHTSQDKIVHQPPL